MDIIYNTTLSYSFSKYAKEDPYNHIRMLLGNIQKRAPLDENGNPIKYFFTSNGEKIDFNRNPLVYSMIGSFDFLIIYEIISLAFLNKLLVNTSLSKDNTYMFNKNSDLVYQGFVHNLSGFTVKSGEIREKIIDESFDNKYTFIGVTEFKLNNAYIISGGIDFVILVINHIQFIVGGHSHFITYSFSSYEIILTLFGEDLAEMNEILLKLREIIFEKLFENISDAETNGACNFYKEIKCDKPSKHNVFSDTQTSYGIRLDQAKKGTGFKLCNNFKDKEIFIDCEFKIKPTFLGNFIDKITTIKKDKKVENSIKFLPGKTDFKFSGKFTSIEYNEIFNLYNTNNSFSSIVRSIVSQIEFDVPESLKKFNQYPPSSKNDHLNKLSINVSKLDNLDAQLKSIGVTEQIRYRFIKMFQIFNTGINNTVTFNLYFDMYLFFIKIIADVDEIANQQKLMKPDISNMDIMNSIKIQNWFSEIISKFEKAYHVRLMHNFNFNEGNEIFVNYNSSIQGFVSDIDAIMKQVVGDIFKLLFNKKNLSAHIICIIDQSQTKSDRYFCNFEMTSTIHPGLLFNFISKEAFVVVSRYNCFVREFDQPIDSIYIMWENYLNSKISNHWFIKRFEKALYNQSVNVRYYFMDLIRCLIFFTNDKDADFELFAFWHNATILQTSINYAPNKRLSEYEFGIEISRLIFIYLITNNNSEPAEKSTSFKDFLKFNPFDREFQKENNIIWHKMAKELFSLIWDFLETENSIFKVKILIRTIITDLTRQVKNNENINIHNGVNFEIIKIMKDYFIKGMDFFGGKLKVNDSSKTEKFKKDYLFKNERYNKLPLVCDTQGGFWFTDITRQLQYNKMNFKYAIDLSNLCYQSKFEMFKKLNDPNVIMEFE